MNLQASPFPPTPIPNSPEKPKSPFEALRAQIQNYETPAHAGKLHALILGDKGAGKTRLALTCPRPILIHSFDPGGTETVRTGIDEGWIISDSRFEIDNPSNPSAFMNWENEFKRLKSLGAFETIGTYILDTLSTMSTCAIWQIMKKEGRTPPSMSSPMNDKSHGMRTQDWGTLLTELSRASRNINTLPCHTIMTGHISRDMDMAVQSYIKGLLVAGQSKDAIPNITQEMYILKVKRTSSGTERVLLTQNDGEYRATTRMGREGIFNVEEPANIKNLLKKAKYDFEDKI